MNPSKTALRQGLLKQRRALTESQRNCAAEKLTNQLIQWSCFQSARQIAIYWAMPDELNLFQLMKVALSQHKQVYLPKIYPNNALRFLPYNEHVHLSPNRYKIPEPCEHLESEEAIAPHLLELVFVPGVAFDREGHRLGMGKGFYDRTFQDKRPGYLPILVGVAYDFQLLKEIPSATHDITMDVIATETELLSFTAHSQLLDQIKRFNGSL